MSRYSKFDKQRLGKLFGSKHKLINKQNLQPPKINQTPTSKKPLKIPNTTALPRKQKNQIMSIPCYDDDDVFGGQLSDLLREKPNQSFEDSPQMQHEMEKGAGNLKEELELRAAEEEGVEKDKEQNDLD